MKKSSIIAAMTACALTISGCGSSAPEIVLKDAAEILSLGYINKEKISNPMTDGGKSPILALKFQKPYNY